MFTFFKTKRKQKEALKRAKLRKQVKVNTVPTKLDSYEWNSHNTDVKGGK